MPPERIALNLRGTHSVSQLVEHLKYINGIVADSVQLSSGYRSNSGILPSYPQFTIVISHNTLYGKYLHDFEIEEYGSNDGAVAWADLFGEFCAAGEERVELFFCERLVFASELDVLDGLLYGVWADDGEADAF